MDMDREKTRRAEHTVSLRAREGLEVRGVTDVISFDEQAVVLQTVCGTMTVEGASLHIHVLSMEEGIVTMDGRIDAVSYEDAEESDPNGKGGFFGKLFR